MRCLDLFCGAAGGWTAGTHRAGWQTVAACEVDPWRRAVFAHRWPGVVMFDDVCRLTARALADDAGCGRIDAIIGSPPCQDASTANAKGRGLDGERTGLFFEYVRLVRELRPRWALAENVPGIRARGVDRVLAEMEALGYTGWPLVVGAWHAGAPHRRNRVWFVWRRNDAAGQPEQPLQDAICAANADGQRQLQEPQGDDGEHEQRSAQRRGQLVAAGAGAGIGVGRGPVAEGDAAAGSVAARDVAAGRCVHADAAPVLGPALAGREPDGVGAGATPNPSGDGVRQQPGRRGGPDGAGAAEPAGDDGEPVGVCGREGQSAERRSGQSRGDGREMLAGWDHWNGGAPGLGRVDDGVSAALAARRGIGRACLAAYGDAAVPEIPYRLALAVNAIMRDAACTSAYMLDAVQRQEAFDFGASDQRIDCHCMDDA